MSEWHEQNERLEDLLPSVRQSNQRARLACPFCADEGHRDKKLSLTISMITGRWKCFRCQLWGTLRSIAGDDAVFDPRDVVIEEEEPDAFEKPPEFLPLAGDRSYTFKQARQYLRSRKVPEKLWERLSIHVCDEGFWSGRIIVPFFDPKKEGAWLGWIARLWTAKPRPRAQGTAAMPYLYPANMQKGTYFYNHNAINRETEKPVLVVEGAFDAFPYYPSVVACLGKPSHKQIKALEGSRRPVCVCLDGDAWEEAHMLSCQLQFKGVQAGSIRLPAGYDPATVPPQRVRDAAVRSIGQFAPVRL